MKHIKLFENFNEIVEEVVELLETDNLETEPQETLEELKTETKETEKVLNFVDFMGK